MENQNLDNLDNLYKVVSFLHPEKDGDLMRLIYDKISELTELCKEVKYINYKNSDLPKSSLAHGRNYVYKEFVQLAYKCDKRIGKIEKIIDNTDCDNCKYSVSKKFNQGVNNFYLGSDKNNPVCISCCDRYEKLCDIKEGIEEVKRAEVQKIVDDSNFIVCRYLVHQINRKLTTLKQTK